MTGAWSIVQFVLQYCFSTLLSHHSDQIMLSIMRHKYEKWTSQSCKKASVNYAWALIELSQRIL